MANRVRRGSDACLHSRESCGGSLRTEQDITWRFKTHTRVSPSRMFWTKYLLLVLAAPTETFLRAPERDEVAVCCGAQSLVLLRNFGAHRWFFIAILRLSELAY